MFVAYGELDSASGNLKSIILGIPSDKLADLLDGRLVVYECGDGTRAVVMICADSHREAVAKLTCKGLLDDRAEIVGSVDMTNSGDAGLELFGHTEPRN